MVERVVDGVWAGFGLDASFSSESETASAAAMVKLTPELLVQAPSAINPIRERQLDLRGESAKESYIARLADRPQRIQNPHHRKLGCHQGMCRLIASIALPVVSSDLHSNSGPA